MKYYIFSALSLFAFSISFAAQVGDYNLTQCNFPGVAAYKSEMIVESLDPITDHAIVKVSDSNGNVFFINQKVSSLVKSEEINRKIISECGKSPLDQLVQVTVPAGTYLACKVAMVEQSKVVGYLYQADVPFMTIKTEYESGGSCESLVIKNN